MQYRFGLVEVENGSATVTGSATKWESEVGAGDLFTIVGTGVNYEVAEVVSDTELTLTSEYAGTTASGLEYVIHRGMTPNFEIPYIERGDIETASILKVALNKIDQFIWPGFSVADPQDGQILIYDGSEGAYVNQSVWLGFTITEPEDGEVLVYDEATGTFINQAPSVPLASPSVTVGLTAKNGSASTAMRSDAAPALDVSISPTWTGTHAFTSASGFSGSALEIRNTNPILGFYDTNGGTDEKFGYLLMGESGFELGTSNDSASAWRTFLSGTRDGYGIESLTYGNATDMPTHKVYGYTSIDVGSANGIEITGGTSENWLRLTPVSGGDATANTYLASNSSGGYLWKGNYIFYWAEDDSEITGITYGNSVDLPDHNFYGDFVSTNTFTGTPAYLGTRTGVSIGRDSSYPAIWTYRGDSSTNEKRWAWYHGLGYGGRMGLYAWADDANSYKSALTIDRSGTSIATLTFGNSTDEPHHYFYGRVFGLTTATATEGSIEARSTQPGISMYKTNGGTNEKMWLDWVSGSTKVHSIWDDAGSASKNYISIVRSGNAITSLTFGNATDLPVINMSGEVHFRSDIWHEDAHGNNRFYFQNNGRTYYGAPTANGSIAYEWRNGANAAIMQMRDTGDLIISRYIRNSAEDLACVFNDTLFTYGTAVLTGTKGGYCGLTLWEGGYNPTFMSDGTVVGTYLQNAGRWSFYDDNDYFRVDKKIIITAGGVPYTRITTGGSSAGGNITISTSAPSGTPADGDIWIQREA